MKKVHAFLLASMMTFSIVAITFSSCRVTLPPPAKSASQIVNTLDIQAGIISLYDVMIASPDKRYTTFESDYASLGSKIDTLVSFNLMRPHGSNILQQTILLQTYFYKYAGNHKTSGTISKGDLRSYKEYLKSFTKPILVSELSLK